MDTVFVADTVLMIDSVISYDTFFVLKPESWTNYAWQLATTIIAVLGAFAGGLLIAGKQIKHSFELDNKRLKRKIEREEREKRGKLQLLYEYLNSQFNKMKTAHASIAEKKVKPRELVSDKLLKVEVLDFKSLFYLLAGFADNSVLIGSVNIIVSNIRSYSDCFDKLALDDKKKFLIESYTKQPDLFEGKDLIELEDGLYKQRRENYIDNLRITIEVIKPMLDMLKQFIDTKGEKEFWDSNISNSSSSEGA